MKLVEIFMKEFCMKKIIPAVIVIMVAAIFFAGCKNPADEDTTPVYITGVQIKHNNTVVTTLDGAVGGADITLVAEVLPAATTEVKTVEWSSSDETKATVSTAGVVHFVGAGEVTITATTKGKKANGMAATASVMITVAAEPPKVTGVVIKNGENDVTNTTLDLMVGADLILVAEVSPSSVSDADKVIEWTTSDAFKATVTTAGVVTGIVEGTVTITATTAGNKDDGSPAAAVVTISVTPVIDRKLVIFNQTGAPEETTPARDVSDADFDDNGRLTIKNTSTTAGWGTDLSKVAKNTFVYLNTPLQAPFSISARVKITQLIASAGTDNGVFIGAFTNPTVDNSTASTSGGEPEDTTAPFIALAGINSATSGRRSVYGTRLNSGLINNSATGTTQFTENVSQEYVYTVTQGTVGTYTMLVADDAFDPPRLHTPYTSSGINRTGASQIHPNLGAAAAGETAEINPSLYLGILVSGVEAEISNIIIKQGETVIYSKPAPATPYPSVTSVTIITNADGASVEVDGNLQMTAIVSPEGAYQGVTWKVDPEDAQYAEINSDTGALKGLDAGTARVYAVSIDNGASGSPVRSDPFEVTITEAHDEELGNNRSWNFQQLPVGWTDGTTLSSDIPMEDYDYGQGLILASSTRTLRITTTQNPPSGTIGWSAGVLQQGGVSPSLFGTIKDVQGPFTLTFNYCGTGSSGTDLRRIKVKIGEDETDAGEDYGAPTTGTPKTWVFTYSGTDKVDVELHGVVNSVRLYDLILAYTGN
jgi:uncharacterized protein YjdB